MVTTQIPSTTVIQTVQVQVECLVTKKKRAQSGARL
jgi:hypothetical protein